MREKVTAADQLVSRLVAQEQGPRVKGEPSASPKQGCGYVDASLLRKHDFSIFILFLKLSGG